MASSVLIGCVRRLGFLILFLPLVLVITSGVSLPQAAHSLQPVLSKRLSHLSPGPLQAIPHGDNGTSANWSGFAVSGATFTDVQGSWIEPTVACQAGETSASSFWVGIDGAGNETVEQTGTDADCYRGRPDYLAWYEMYPEYAVEISKPVFPGDVFQAEVNSPEAGTFRLILTNVTRGWTFSITRFSSQAERTSAEWIAEAPGQDNEQMPLANFGTVHFSNCSANNLAIDSLPQMEEIAMETQSGTLQADPSAVGSNTLSVFSLPDFGSASGVAASGDGLMPSDAPANGGASFDVVWSHS